MKKVIVTLAFALVFAAAPASAQVVDCSLTPCPSNGDPKAVMQAWGLTGAQTPSIAAGSSVTDEHGLVDVCPAWYGKFMCADITRTAYYQEKMLALAKDLVAKGNTAAHFPAFKGWMDAVR